MTALDFYKFIKENEIEYHWHFNEDTEEADVIFFPYYSQIEEMRKIMSVSDFDDEGIQCTMKDGYFAFWASDILSHYGISLSDVFEKDDKKQN